MRRFAETVLYALLVAACVIVPIHKDDGMHQLGPIARLIRVKAKEAVKKGLPPIGFSIELTGTAMSGLAFPEKGLYLTASGPPGGTLLMQVLSYEAKIHDPAALDAQIRAHFSKAWQQPLVLHQQGTLRLAGKQRPARAFMTGKSGMTRARWCAALVSPTGASGAGLLVAVGEAAGPDDPVTCAAVTAHKELAPLIRSFILE